MQNRNLFPTTDLNFVAYLLAKGHSYRRSERNGRFYEFYFNPEIEEIARSWLTNPNEEMKLVQEFLSRKERLLDFVRTKENKVYGRPQTN